MPPEITPVQQKSSKTKYIIIAAIITAVLVIVGGAAYAIAQINTEKISELDTTQQQSVKAAEGDVTQQELTQQMSDVDATIKEGKDSYSEAKKAIDDASQRVKVSE